MRCILVTTESTGRLALVMRRKCKLPVVIVRTNSLQLKLDCNANNRCCRLWYTQRACSRDVCNLILSPWRAELQLCSFTEPSSVCAFGATSHHQQSFPTVNHIVTIIQVEQCSALHAVQGGVVEDSATSLLTVPNCAILDTQAKPDVHASYLSAVYIRIRTDGKAFSHKQPGKECNNHKSIIACLLMMQEQA